MPSRYTSEASEYAYLHRLHVSYTLFRGLDAGSLLRLFKDSLKDIYDNIISLDRADAYRVPENYFTAAFNDAVEAAMDHPAVELDVKTQLHLFEFNKITKTGGGGGSTAHMSP